MARCATCGKSFPNPLARRAHQASCTPAAAHAHTAPANEAACEARAIGFDTVASSNSSGTSPAAATHKAEGCTVDNPFTSLSSGELAPELPAQATAQSPSELPTRLTAAQLVPQAQRLYQLEMAKLAPGASLAAHSTAQRVVVTERFHTLAAEALREYDRETLQFVTADSRSSGLYEMLTSSDTPNWALPSDRSRLAEAQDPAQCAQILSELLIEEWEHRVSSLRNEVVRLVAGDAPNRGSKNTESFYRHAGDLVHPHGVMAKVAASAGVIEQLFTEGYIVLDGLLDVEALGQTASVLRTDYLDLSQNALGPSNNPCNQGALNGSVVGVHKEGRPVAYPQLPAAAECALSVVEGMLTELAKRWPHALNLPKQWQLGVYPPGQARYKRHLDNYSGLEPQNRRELTALLYLNEDWKLEEDGGALRLHLGKEGQQGVEDVSPIGGRCVVFASRSMWHEVLPSRLRHRVAATLWVERCE